MGIYEPSDMDEIYEIKETHSYLKVLCKMSKKCAFSVWFKFQKNRFGEYIQIKCHRSKNAAESPKLIKFPIYISINQCFI